MCGQRLEGGRLPKLPQDSASVKSKETPGRGAIWHTCGSSVGHVCAWPFTGESRTMHLVEVSIYRGSPLRTAFLNISLVQQCIECSSALESINRCRLVAVFCWGVSWLRGLNADSQELQHR